MLILICSSTFNDYRPIQPKLHFCLNDEGIFYLAIFLGILLAPTSHFFIIALLIEVCRFFSAFAIWEPLLIKQCLLVRMKETRTKNCVIPKNDTLSTTKCMEQFHFFTHCYRCLKSGFLVNVYSLWFLGKDFVKMRRKKRSLKTDKWWRPITLYALKLWENHLFERSVAPRWTDFMTSKKTIKPNDSIKRKLRHRECLTYDYKN